MHIVYNKMLMSTVVQAKEESELPEYILGTVRLSRVRPDSAIQFEV